MKLAMLSTDFHLVCVRVCVCLTTGAEQISMHYDKIQTLLCQHR